MKDLVITQNITLDGVVEATDDWFGGAGGEGHDDLDAALAAQRDASDGVLAGRGTFESMRDFWGPRTDDTPPAWLRLVESTTFRRGRRGRRVGPERLDARTAG